MISQTTLAFRLAFLPAFHDKANIAFFSAGELPEAPADDAFGRAIADNHRHNMQLWTQEDLARRRNVPDAEIVLNKRNIDVMNQARNDAVEGMDALILSAFAAMGVIPAGRLNSETPGSMIDRLSIASLKRYHMGIQATRSDADEAHRHLCTASLARLKEQGDDLFACLQSLLCDCEQGRAYFKIYRQFKMYNDPALSPRLRAASGNAPVLPKVQQARN